MTALLSVENFSVSFGRRGGLLFDNVSFDVQPGEVAVIVGDSGAGKTTLLHFIAGFVRPYVPPQTISEFLWRGVFPVPREANICGTVRINGEDVTQLPPSQRDIGLVMQRFSLYPNMTAKENLLVPLRARDIDPSQLQNRVAEIASKMHIDFPLESRPNQLSGGQAQRVAIGKLLARDPLLALCDEAFSNLDFKLRQTLRKEVIQERTSPNAMRDGVRYAVLFVSHDLHDAEEADRIIYLKRTDKDAREKRPTQVSTFGGGRGEAWKQFCRETNYHIVQLVTVGADS